MARKHGAGRAVGTGRSESARVRSEESQPPDHQWMLACKYLRREEDIDPWHILFLARQDRLDLMQQVWELYTADRKRIDMNLWVGHWHAAMLAAACRGNLLMVKWLAEQTVGREICASKMKYSLLDMVCEAAERGQFPVAEYIRRQGELKPSDPWKHWNQILLAIRKGVWT